MANVTGVVAEWLSKQYGGKYSYTVTPVTVGTTAAYVTQNNPERAFLLFVNTSVNTIVLLPEQLPTYPAGIILSPSGGYNGFTLWDDLVMPSLQYGAVASGAGSVLLVIECIRIARTPQGGQ